MIGLSEPGTAPPRPGAVRPDILTPQFLAKLRASGVVAAQLFGSVARREEGADSDIDLLVEFHRPVSYGERFVLSEGSRASPGDESSWSLTSTRPSRPTFSLPSCRSRFDEGSSPACAGHPGSG